MRIPRGHVAMYMHTLDGKPASYDAERRYIYFCGRSTHVTLVPSLRHIRREQQASIATAWREQPEWSDPKRYGYVRVSVPRGAATRRSDSNE